MKRHAERGYYLLKDEPNIPFSPLIAHISIMNGLTAAVILEELRGRHS